MNSYGDIYVGGVIASESKNPWIRYIALLANAQSINYSQALLYYSKNREQLRPEYEEYKNSTNATIPRAKKVKKRYLTMEEKAEMFMNESPEEVRNRMIRHSQQQEMEKREKVKESHNRARFEQEYYRSMDEERNNNIRHSQQQERENNMRENRNIYGKPGNIFKANIPTQMQHQYKEQYEPYRRKPRGPRRDTGSIFENTTQSSSTH